MQAYDVVVLGAGAAGLMCGIEAARRGRRTLVLDHAKAAGEKIRISGGGRCNFTNLAIAPERFLSQNPRFAISALTRYTQHDFIARVDAAGIAWHEKTLGQLFCDASAKQIVSMLLGDLNAAGGEIRLGVTIGEVLRADGFSVATSAGTFFAPAVVVATGGRSIPKMGATGFAYLLADRFGVPVVPTRPGLVPLTFDAPTLAAMGDLAGVSVPARVTCGPAAFEEGLLFTHRGLSGPSILQVSSYWHEGDSLSIDLCAAQDVAADLRAQRTVAGKGSVKNALARLVPEKLARIIAGDVAGTLADQSNAGLDRIAQAVHDWRIRPSGSEGYRTAEVTVGGIDTDALDARSMQAKAVPGLHFIGEAVDVTGWLGGYNFQWAWSSGWAAGQAV